MLTKGEYPQLDEIQSVTLDAIGAAMMVVGAAKQSPYLLNRVAATAAISMRPDTLNDTADARCAVLKVLCEIEANTDWRKNQLVKQLRHAGTTWKAIGDALGTSRSAAQQRYDFLSDSLGVIESV